MPTLTAGEDTRIHYTDQGQGRPVVLIHGWPLNGESWQGQVPALLEAGYRVITYDRRGFGSSDKPASGYDYDTFASDLNALMEHLDLRDATLVGFSMGGGEVARYVGTYGTDRVRSVVFAGGIPPRLLKDDEHPDGALDQATVATMQQALRADREGFLDEFLTNFFSADGELKVTEDQRQAALAQARQADLEAAAQCIGTWVTDFSSDLERVTVPTLVIHGDADAIVPPEASGRRTHERIPGSDLHLLEDGPHGINASHTSEFNEALLDFLKR